MCLIAFATDVADHVLVLAANRDEAYVRPTLPAHRWSDAPAVVGGRDLDAGGSWLALAATGRLAAVTNVRAWPVVRGLRSRGALCRDFVTGSADGTSFGRAVLAERAAYADFNLVLYDGRTSTYVSGRAGAPVPIEPGVHGLSNASLDVPWPKVRRSTAALRAALAGPPDALVDALFAILADRRGTTDEDLPATGVPLEFERELAPVFVASAAYGTRSSTVIVWRRDGHASFEERSFGPGGTSLGVARFDVDIRASASLR